MKSFSNTLNVCVGHKPFPSQYWHHIDLMLAPQQLADHPRLQIIPDQTYGPYGNSLSEYSQLFWLNDNLETTLNGRTYLRVFHYRRFVSSKQPNCGKKSLNHPWAMTITPDQVQFFSEQFCRFAEKEIFNTPIRLQGGVVSQYQTAHVVEDFYRFCTFLIESNTMDRSTVLRFMRSDILIPSSSICIVHAKTFSDLMLVLRKAAGFLDSHLYVPRYGYQRRSVGFLLERLQSFLILDRLVGQSSQQPFGYHIVLSETDIVEVTN
jgi:hypothetical protein